MNSIPIVVSILLMIFICEIVGQSLATKGGSLTVVANGQLHPPGKKRLSSTISTTLAPNNPKDHTEIIVLDPNEDDEEEEEDEDMEPGQDKRVPVPSRAPRLPVQVIKRKLNARSAKPQTMNNEKGADINNDQQHNWWARKDLRLRKLHKKLDQEEQQMMELMYGYLL